jgi:hypothetical protein
MAATRAWRTFALRIAEIQDIKCETRTACYFTYTKLERGRNRDLVIMPSFVV